VHRPALGIAGARHQAGVFEHSDVTGDSLGGDRKERGELVDGRRVAAESGDDGSSHRVREGREGQIQTFLVDDIASPRLS
jgi:hypothetical protein